MLDYAKKTVAGAEFVHGRAESLPWIADSSVDLLAAGTSGEKFMPQVKRRQETTHRIFASCLRLIFLNPPVTLAHWFDPIWWKEAGRILKPQGTLAVFIYGGLWPGE